MASLPPNLTLSASLTPQLVVSKNENLNIQNKNITTKTAYFKLGTTTSTTNTVMEVITKDAKDIQVSDKIQITEDDSYYISQIDKSPVKFASGSPLISQTTSVRFPKPEAQSYAPEKVATFLIFKK